MAGLDAHSRRAPRHRRPALFRPAGNQPAFARTPASRFPHPLRVEIYEMREPDAAMQKIDPADAGNLESWLVPRDQIESALRAASATIARIRAMLPANADAIQCRVPAGANEVALAFHGMQFARWTKQGVFSAWEIPRSNSPPRTNAPSSVCCTNSICTAARSPPTRITRCIAAPRNDGSNRSCSKIPQNSTRNSTPAIFIRKFPRCSWRSRRARSTRHHAPGPPGRNRIKSIRRSAIAGASRGLLATRPPPPTRRRFSSATDISRASRLIRSRHSCGSSHRACVSIPPRTRC